MFLEFNKYTGTLVFPDRTAVIKFSSIVPGQTYMVNLSENFNFYDDAPYPFTALTDVIDTATAFTLAVNSGFYGVDYTAVRIDNVVFVIATSAELLNGFAIQNEDGISIDILYLPEFDNVNFSEIEDGCNCLPVQIGDTIKFFIPDTMTESLVEVWLIDDNNNMVVMIDNFTTTGEIVDNLTFDSSIPEGKYRIAMFVDVFSSPLQIYSSNICFELKTKHPNSYIVRYRNQDNAFGIRWEDMSDWLQLRLPFFETNNQITSKDTAFKDSEGKLRLLQSATEKEITLQTDYLNSYIHEQIAYSLRHDEFQVLIDRKWLTFQLSGEYRIERVENSIFQLFKAQFKLIQSKYQNWNSFC